MATSQQEEEVPAKTSKVSTPSKKASKKKGSGRNSKGNAKKNLKKDFDDDMTSSPGIKTYFPAKQEASLLVEKVKPAPTLAPAKDTGGKIVFTLPKGGDNNLGKFLQNLSAKNSAHVEKEKAPQVKEKSPEVKAGASGTMTSLLNEDNSLTR